MLYAIYYTYMRVSSRSQYIFTGRVYLKSISEKEQAVDLTHQSGESKIILNNELTKTLHMKYNGNIYYRQGLEISNCS